MRLGMRTVAASAVLVVAAMLCLGDAKAQTSTDIGRWGAAVVTVLTEKGHGTGFHIAPGGYVVTAYHVARGQRNLRIRLRTGEVRYVLATVHEDELRDLAVLSVDGSGLAEVPLGDSDRLRPGDEIIAIGTPVAVELGHTVTKGIVSSVRRLTSGVKILQTQTPVSQGNSGGPLFNSAGEVVGIVSFQVRPELGQNLNFAVAVNELHGMLGSGPSGGGLGGLGRGSEGSPGGVTPFVARFTIHLSDGRNIPAESYEELPEGIAIKRPNISFTVPREIVLSIEDRRDGKVTPVRVPVVKAPVNSSSGGGPSRSAPATGPQDAEYQVHLKSGSRVVADSAWIEKEWVIYERRGHRNKVRAADVHMIMDVELERQLAACRNRFDQAKYRVGRTVEIAKQLESESVSVYEQHAIRRAANQIISMEASQAQAVCDRFALKWIENRDRLNEAAGISPIGVVGTQEASVAQPRAISPAKPVRVDDPECAGGSFEVERDGVRVITFNVIEVVYRGKRLIVDLEDLTGTPSLSAANARMLLEGIMRGRRNTVVLRGPDTGGRAKGILCVDGKNIASHPHLKKYRVSR